MDMQFYIHWSFLFPRLLLLWSTCFSLTSSRGMMPHSPILSGPQGFWVLRNGRTMPRVTWLCCLHSSSIGWSSRWACWCTARIDGTNGCIQLEFVIFISTFDRFLFIYMDLLLYYCLLACYVCEIFHFCIYDMAKVRYNFCQPPLLDVCLTLK